MIEETRDQRIERIKEEIRGGRYETKEKLSRASFRFFLKLKNYKTPRD